MVALSPPVCDFGWPAPDFSLPGVEGRLHTLNSARGKNGLLLMFICNHCPYVQAVLEDLIADCRNLKAEGIGCIAVMSNDTAAYPDDAFPLMQSLAERMDFPFPYVYDESQEVARAYGAVCTPDFFGFNARLELQYRGRLNAAGRQRAEPGMRRELLEAMKLVSQTGQGPKVQTASIGCSIKWREA